MPQRCAADSEPLQPCQFPLISGHFREKRAAHDVIGIPANRVSIAQTDHTREGILWLERTSQPLQILQNSGGENVVCFHDCDHEPGWIAEPFDIALQKRGLWI